MFTANEIRQTGFLRAGISGYKAADVDEFRYKVADDFEILENSNRELVEKIKVLAAHIEELKEKEESVKTCIINAQITADKVIGDADKKAKDMILNAEEKAESIIQEANKKADFIYDETKKKGEEFLSNAKEKSDDIVAEAENESIILRNETDKKINAQKQVYLRLKEEILKYRDSSIEQCMKQLEILKNISDSELVLDTIISEDITNDEFNEKVADNSFVPVKDDGIEEDEDLEEDVLLEEIEEEEDETQGSFFEYKQ